MAQRGHLGLRACPARSRGRKPSLPVEASGALPGVPTGSPTLTLEAAGAPIKGGAAQSWMYTRVAGRHVLVSLHRCVQPGQGTSGTGGPALGALVPSHLGLLFQAGLVSLLLHPGPGQRRQ